MPAITCSAPGKVILCGEHAVVYGKPAIALPVFNLKTRCTILAKPTSNIDDTIILAPNIGLKSRLACLVEDNPIRVAVKLILDHFSLDHLPVCEIRINSSLPAAAGLGSSASTSVALVRALSTFLGHPLDNEDVNRIAFEIEKIHHGTPSGIDNTVITYEKALFFIKGQPAEFINPVVPLTLVIADSGIKGSTSKAVADVRNGWLNDETKYNSFFNQIKDLSILVRESLEIGDLSVIGKALSDNHTLLKKIGVSCDKLDSLVDCALKNGAYGAKLSGGGQGGNMIALVKPEDAQSISSQLRSAGAVNTIVTQLPARGHKTK